MDRIMSPKDARRFTDREFIFSDALTANSELEEELNELDSMKEEKKSQKLVQTVISFGGAVGLVFATVKGLNNIERWMKQMEVRDIEEEQRLTGQYISVDASDVDTAIDPNTGKNLTISKAKSANSTSPAASTASAAEGEGTGKKAPWLLRVLGLDNAVSADDDDFWEPVAATVSKPKAPKDGGDGAAGAGSPSTDGGEEGGDGEGDNDSGDDSSGVDVLDDLLG